MQSPLATWSSSKGVYVRSAAVYSLILISCAFLSVAAPVAAGQADSHAEQGLVLARKGDLPGAESELRNAAKLAPNNAEILASLGTVLAMQKKLEESTNIFQKELKLAPGDLTVRRYLAVNLWQLRRFKEARADLEILLKKNPKDKQGRLLLGMVAENTMDYATAARMLGSVPELARSQPESIAALARSYYRLDEKQKARDTLALLAQSGDTRPILLGAEIADQAHDYETAETMLENLRSSQPDDPQVSYQLALVQYHSGRFDLSQKSLVQLAASHPSSQVYNLLGWSQYKQNQVQPAFDSFEHAIDLAPSEDSNYLDLTNLAVAAHSLPLALATARKATIALPDSAQAFALRGSVETQVGEFTDAVASYARALSLDKTQPSFLAGLAGAQFSAGLNEEAFQTFDTAMKQFPKDAGVRLLYGAALVKRGEAGDPQASEKAHQAFREALALDPSSAQAHYELGKLVLAQGSVPEAIRYLERAVKLDDHNAEAHFALARAYRRAGRTQDAAREMQLYQKWKDATGGSASSNTTAEHRN